MGKKILVTGGAGFIGSTVCSALMDTGHTPIILDSLINGCRDFTRGRIFYEGDIKDPQVVGKILKDHPDLYLIIHCAALIVVNESVEKPYEYYLENVSKSLEFFRMVSKTNIQGIVFSSSASVYDVVDGFMVSENSALHPRSPYARSKLMMEMILRDFADAYHLKSLILRYFNPIGADPKMRSGAYVKNPTHILGKLIECSVDRSKIFEMTGVDWPTRDGTGLRDYIHVWDLANAHVATVEQFEEIFKDPKKESRSEIINLGTGHGVTVKELVAAFERVLGAPIHKVEAKPRPGDTAGAYASCEKAARLLKWKAEKSIEEGIQHALAWMNR